MIGVEPQGKNKSIWIMKQEMRRMLRRNWSQSGTVPENDRAKPASNTSSRKNVHRDKVPSTTATQRQVREQDKRETIPQRELLGGTVPARTCQTRESLPTKLSQTHWNRNYGMNDAQSESWNENARDELGSLNLSSSSFKNQPIDENQSKVGKKSISKIESLKNFWENPGKTDLNNRSKPKCVRPMRGKQYRQIYVTNQPQTGRDYEVQRCNGHQNLTK